MINKALLNTAANTDTSVTSIENGVTGRVLLNLNGDKMKKVNTKASPKQKEFHENLDYLGFMNLIGYGASDASKKILEVLG